MFFTAGARGSKIHLINKHQHDFANPGSAGRQPARSGAERQELINCIIPTIKVTLQVHSPANKANF